LNPKRWVDDIYSKVLGCFLGAAIGDAMGAPTEIRTTKQIKERFGGTVTTFMNPPEDNFSRGYPAYHVTDDFSAAYVICKQIIKANGSINKQVVQDAVIEWSKQMEYFYNFAGPSTRVAVERMKQNIFQKSTLTIDNFFLPATNGAAMKVFPAGLINPGNLDKAIENAVTIGSVTHDNFLSISGACAVAASVSEALKKNTDLYNVVQAGIYGAVQGEKIGREVAAVFPGPSVVKRTQMAISIGLKSLSVDKAMQDIADLVGNGMSVSETVPAAFGLIVAAHGDVMDSIIGGVNIGYDTDTIATIAGAITGALNGASPSLLCHLGSLNQINSFDIESVAKGMYEVSNKESASS